MSSENYGTVPRKSLPPYKTQHDTKYCDSLSQSKAVFSGASRKKRTTSKS